MQMQIKDLFLENLLNENLSFGSVFLGLTISLLLSSIISLIYKAVNDDQQDNHIVMQSLILLSVTIAGAMMVIGNNLARAFGLVGAVSIIRFRTAVKNSRDMAFVFISIVIGMASGLGSYLVVAIFTALISVVLLFMKYLKYGQRGRRLLKYDLVFSFDTGTSTRIALETELTSNTVSWKFLGLKSGKKKCTFSYCIWTDYKSNIDDLITSLNNLTEQSSVSLSAASK